MKTKVLLGLLLPAFLTLAYARGNFLAYGELYAPNYFWPYFSEDPVTLRMLDLYMRPLIYNMSDVKDAPKDFREVLVDRVRLSDISWTRTPHLKLRLKRDLRWSGGDPITAYDVVKTFKFLSSGRVSTVYKYVRNIISRIEADPYDERLVKVNFRFPSSKIFTSLNFFILPEKIAGDPEGYSSYADDVDEIKNYCNGPYVPNVESKTAGEFEFVRNENAPKRPSIEKVILKTFPDVPAMIDNLLIGNVHMIMDIPPSIFTLRLEKSDKKKENVKIKGIFYTENRFYFVMLNYRKKEFHDRGFRVALIKALDRNELGAAFNRQVEIITGPFIPGSRWSNPGVKMWEYDPGVDLSRYSTREFTLIHLNLENYPKLAAGIVAMWRRAGLKVRRVPYKKVSDFWEALKSGNFDMALFEYVSAKNFVSLSPLLNCRGAMNFAAYNCGSTYQDEDVMKLLNAVEGFEAFNISPEKRLELYHKLHRILHEKETHIWLFTVQRSVYYNTNIVIPYLSPSRPFKNIEDWYLKSLWEVEGE